MHHSLKPEGGNRYGRLTVVSVRPTRTTKHGAEWRCVCDCGAIIVARGTSLRAGNTKSCGCLLREVTGARSQARHDRRRADIRATKDDRDMDPDVLIAEELGL